MKRSILILTLAASALFLPAAASASPCLPSAEAVRQAHPGVHTHADWHFIDNRKCWMNRGEWDGRHQSIRSEQPRPVDRNRSAGVRAVQQAREVIAPTKVKTVAAPVLAAAPPPAPAETTGVAAAGSMSSPWTEDFYPLLQGREEHAQFIPAVLTITETRIAEKRPETTVISLREPSNLRSEFRRDMLHLLAGILAIIAVIGLLTFLVGEIQRLLRTREARR